MTRTQATLLTLGILMILYGVASKSWLTGGEEGPDGTGRTEESSKDDSPEQPSFAELPGPRRTGAAPGRASARGANRGAQAGSTGDKVALRLILKDAATGLPSAGATAELWRSPKGEGPSFRPARRLSSVGGSAADREGRVTLSAPLGLGLEVMARTQDGGPRERLIIGTLQAAPVDPIEIRLRRPPRPLEVRVTDSANRPIPGVSIRIVVEGIRSGAEYATTGVLGSRTGGDGRSTLSGKARTARWILLDAPGYSPKSVSLPGLAPDAHIDVALPDETSLELDVVDDAGKALVDAVVEVEFSLAGLATRRTAMTDRRGHVSIGHLPADTPLRPVVTPKGGLAQTVEVLESPAGEALEATLHVVQ